MTNFTQDQNNKNNKKPATTEPPNDSETQKLRSEIQSLQEKCKEYLDGWKRAKADYINREREIERDKSIWMEFITLDFILKILPIAESLEMAMKHKDKNEEFLKGVEQIKKQFDDLLKGLGIGKIKTIGEKFNPEFHEAVGRQQTTDNKQQTTTGEIIVEEVSAGYMMNGKAIKPAKVIVK